VIHVARGNYVEAGFSVIAVVPVYGDAVAGARKVAKAADKVGNIAGQTTKQAEVLVDAGKNVTKAYKSKNLGKNLIDAGITPPKGMKQPQAHHDLPQKFEGRFKTAGLDIHDPKYGRWVEGSPTGNHQKWSYDFNKEWETFFRNNKRPSTEKILNKMNELRANPKFQ
jgi:hypothetical protein